MISEITGEDLKLESNRNKTDNAERLKGRKNEAGGKCRVT